MVSPSPSWQPCPAGGAARWRRAWRPAVAWTAAGVSASANHPALPGCRPAHAQRRPTGPARLATAARREAGVGAGVVSRFRLLAFPGSASSQATRARPRVRRFAVAAPSSCARSASAAAARDRGRPWRPPARRAAARRLRRTLPARRRQRPHPPAAGRGARPGAAPDGLGAVAVHRCPTFPRGPHPGNHGTAPLPAGCRRRGSRSRTR